MHPDWIRAKCGLATDLSTTRAQGEILKLEILMATLIFRTWRVLLGGTILTGDEHHE
ncbi:hypothetical protein GCM10017711_19470 [Paeniglutamicibacter sulfureus]